MRKLLALCIFTFLCIQLLCAQTAEEYFDKGYAASDPKDKVLWYTKAIELDPEYALAYNNRGLAKYYLKDYASTIKDYDRAIELNPEDAIAYNNRGIAKRKLKDYASAIKDYNRAIELDPEYAIAYNNRGNAKDDLGDYASAIKDYDRAIELNPEDAIAYNNRGLAKDDLGDYASAIKDYDRAIELNPEYADAYNNRGIAKDDLGDYASAIKDYDRAIELNPEDAIAYNNRGIAKRKLKGYASAIKDYDRALQIDPEYAAAYVGRGNVKDDLKDYASALKDYDRALQIDPEYAAAYVGRGLAKYYLKDYASALKDYDRAIELNPEYALAYNNRGYTKEQVGNLTGAKQDYEKALVLDPSFLMSKNNLKRLKEKLVNAPIGKVRVVIVGIGDYEYQNELSWPQKQALELYGWMINKHIVSESSTILLGRQAKRQAILDAIKEELCDIHKVKPNDLVIFYFSGHGVILGNEIGICPYEFTYNQPNSLISEQEIMDLLELSPARHKLCVFESCRKMYAAPIPKDTLDKFHEAREQVEGGIVFMNSAQVGELSVGDPDIGGVFSHYFIEGIKGAADTNKDKMITSNELFNYLSPKVMERTKNQQHPQINDFGREEVPIMPVTED